MEVIKLDKLEGEKNKKGIMAKKLISKDNVTLTNLVLAPGDMVPAHSVPVDVFFYIVKGKGTLKIGDEEKVVEEREVIICPPETTMMLKADQGGKIKHFFVVGGCDGRHEDREYYTEFVEELPEDTVILTAGCGKYRFNKLDLGDIDGIPRILDAGQCNDSYSLVVIAKKLAEAMDVDDINDLPISYNISWYEQKAVLVLLALLYLGIKNIRLGPSLPAFISENVLNVLVDKFNIQPNTTVQKDMENMLAE